MRPLTLLLTLLLALSACTADDAGEPAAGPTETATSPAEDTAPASTGGEGFAAIPELVRDVGPSIVNISLRRGPQRGAGSGIIVDEAGLILTNAHVVQEADEIEVAFADGRQLAAELVAADQRTDLAVIRVDADGLPAATLSERTPVVGELVIAVGNPLGFENSVTAGIVSGLERDLPVQRAGAALVGLIQTDAPIAPGNSGGALVDGEGRVIGVNVAQAASRRGGGSLGFAIPTTTVMPVLEQLLENGDVEHAYIGIQGTTLTPQVADRFGIGRQRGAIIARIQEDGPAARSGLEPGDVIIEAGGQTVEDFGDLVGVIRRSQPGDQLTLTVVREGEERTVDVTLGELPS